MGMTGTVTYVYIRSLYENHQTKNNGVKIMDDPLIVFPNTQKLYLSQLQDSGVETGNESNDSLVTQHEMITTIGGNGNEKQEYPVTISTINEIDSETDSKCLALGTTTQLSLIKSIPTIQNFTDTAIKLRSITYSLKYKHNSPINSFYKKVGRDSPHLLYSKYFKERKMRFSAAINNVEVVERLLNEGVSPNNWDDQGRTPLHMAACRGFTDMVKLLLCYGANPNLRDSIGNTPLHLAAVACKISVVTQLLIAGTDILTLDNHGYNPLQLAQTKLRILQDLKGTEVSNIRSEAQNVIDMLLAYLQKQKDSQAQIEALSNFCSKLSLSNTSEQLQDDVKTLLESLSLSN